MSRPEEMDSCLVCQGPDCTLRGSVPISEEIVSRVTASGGTVAIQPYNCFGACPDGPNIVTYPNGVWYSLVQQADAAAIAEHLLGGQPVERLTGAVDPALQGLILEIIDSGLGRFEMD